MVSDTNPTQSVSENNFYYFSTLTLTGGGAIRLMYSATESDLKEFFINNRMASLSHIPGATGLPFIGDTIRFLKKPQELFNKKQLQYGNIFKYHMFGKDYVCIMGAEGNRFVLVEDRKSVV